MKYWKDIQPDKIMLNYEGPISNSVISRLAGQIEDKFRPKECIKRKLFSIFIELAQNILYYSAITQKSNIRAKMCYFMIYEEKEAWVLSTGNYINTHKSVDLQQRCLLINSLSEQELRRYRLNILAQPWSEKAKGAGIGLVKVALISNNHLDISVKKMNEQLSFLTLSTKVSK
ncbi:MAG: SiaB family protein kinase [Microscillaceae bacterium]|nr:SiaB family protein kinase [Microscillaceae bacterium]